MFTKWCRRVVPCLASWEWEALLVRALFQARRLARLLHLRSSGDLNPNSITPYVLPAIRDQLARRQPFSNRSIEPKRERLLKPFLQCFPQGADGPIALTPMQTLGPGQCERLVELTTNEKDIEGREWLQVKHHRLQHASIQTSGRTA